MPTVKNEVLTYVAETVWVANLRGEPKWLRGVIIEQTGPISYQVTVGDDIWRQHIDWLRPGSMASTDTNTSKSDSIDKCPFHESSLQSSTETVPDTPESSNFTEHNVVTQKKNYSKTD